MRKNTAQPEKLGIFMKNNNGRDVGMYSATHETVTVAREQR